MKKVMAVMLMVVTLMTLGGCQKEDENRDPMLDMTKQQLVGIIHGYEDDVDDLTNEIMELTQKLVGVYGEEVDTSAIIKMSDGTGRMTFNTVDGILKFPVPFEYPGSAQAPNTSTINISDSLKVKPTSNWDVRLTGTALELSHSSGIAGVIKVGTLDRDGQKLTIDNIQPHMAEFFAALPPENVKYSRVFIDDNWRGMDAVSHTFINSQDAMMKCGMASFGETSFVYYFVYNGVQDTSKDEVIVSLLSTLYIWGKSFRIEA